MFDPCAALNLTVHDVGFVPDVTAVPDEFDGKLTITVCCELFAPPPMAWVVAAQVAVTVALLALAETTVTVAVPAGPVAPAGPAGPVAPAGPAGPC